MPCRSANSPEPSAGFEPALARGRNPALYPLSYEGMLVGVPGRMSNAFHRANARNSEDFRTISSGAIVAIPILAELHHQYVRI
jgi:hypothetical protein